MEDLNNIFNKQEQIIRNNSDKKTMALLDRMFDDIQRLKTNCNKIIGSNDYFRKQYFLYRKLWEEETGKRINLEKTAKDYKSLIDVIKEEIKEV